MNFTATKKSFYTAQGNFTFRAKYLILVQKKMHMNGILYCINVYLHVHIHVPVFPKYG